MNSLAAEVARVGDTPISAETVKQTLYRNGYNIYDDASARKALEDSVRFELLAAEAKRLGLDKDPEVDRRIKELLVAQLVRQKVDAAQPDVNLSDADLRAYYDTHTNDFRRPSVARGHVLTLLNHEGKEAETQSSAAEAIHALKSGEKPDAVVKKYSDEPAERTSGGLSNYFVEGQPSRRYPEEVAQAMLGLKLRGQVAGPISTPRALYVISLVDRRDGQTTPFEQAKPEARKRLAREQRQQAYDAYCESLKKQFRVTVNEAELKTIVEKSVPGDGPPKGPVGQ